MEERSKAVTFKGRPVTLVGPELRPGRRAPDFTLVDTELQEVSLAYSKGKVRVLSVINSLDSPVCSLQARTFEEEASRYPYAVVYTISAEPPSTLGHYCTRQGIQNSKILSDYRDGSFGRSYGTLIKETGTLARAVFIIDADDMVRYAEYVKEVTEPPDYKKVFETLSEIYGECSRD